MRFRLNQPGDSKEILGELALSKGSSRQFVFYSILLELLLNNAQVEGKHMAIYLIFQAGEVTDSPKVRYHKTLDRKHLTLPQ